MAPFITTHKLLLIFLDGSATCCYNIAVPRLTSFSVASPLLILLPAVTVIWLYFII